MFSRFLIMLILGVLLISCATPQPEVEIDHNTSYDKQSDSGDDRGFDPCKLNSKLPVCK